MGSGSAPTPRVRAPPLGEYPGEYPGEYLGEYLGTASLLIPTSSSSSSVPPPAGRPSSRDGRHRLRPDSPTSALPTAAGRRRRKLRTYRLTYRP